MAIIRSIIGGIIGAGLVLLISRFIPYHPDLTDWGGRTFPRSYLTALIILALIAYVSGWIAGRISPRTGRLSGMFSSLIAVVVTVGWSFKAPVLEQLFQHPAYPIFSDQALLAAAVLLVSGHLGGLRIEKAHLRKLQDGGHKASDCVP
jgi:uncharacterized membrane protein YeaQ/YmgE (transglycosylase-associated protein family)